MSPSRAAIESISGGSWLCLARIQSALTLILCSQSQGAFFPLKEDNWSLPNRAVEPQLEDDERMVYVAFSEFFFDSAMESYFQAGALQLTLVGDKV